MSKVAPANDTFPVYQITFDNDFNTLLGTRLDEFSITEIHEQLEQALAEFTERDAVLAWSGKTEALHYSLFRRCRRSLPVEKFQAWIRVHLAANRGYARRQGENSCGDE